MTKLLMLCFFALSLGLGIWLVPAQRGLMTISGSPPIQEIGIEDLKRLLPGRRLTLINVWASWCEPCKQEFPAILKIREKYQSQGLNVLFLSIDYKPEQIDAEKFLRSQGIDFLTYIGNESPAKLIAGLDSKWQGAVPSSFLFDKAGKLIDSWQGELRYEEFEAKIQPFLKTEAN
jgi:thiol-disulfide isomerase/thioredoxin